MLVVGKDVDFGKYGVAKVRVHDPNVTPEMQRKREERILAVCRQILKDEFGLEMEP